MSTSALPAHAASDTQYDPGIGAALKSLIDRYGITLLGEAGRLRGLLQDECPQAKREMSVLMQALDERIPQDLLRVHSGEPIESLSPRLAKRLSDEKSISSDASRWAVSAWAQGLGLESVIDTGFANRGASAIPVPPHSAANERWGQSDVRPAAAAAAGAGAGGMVKMVLGGAAALALAAGGWFAFMMPKIELVAVDAQGPFVGNGKSWPVNVVFQAKNTQVQSVEVRYVRGEGNWAPQSWTQPVSPEASSRGQASVPVLATQTSKPLSATFQYVAVTQDGKRSQPIERTFEIVPPVLITEAKAPKGVRVGRNFTVALAYQRGGADIVQIERRVVQSSTPWAQPEASLPVKLSAPNGVFDFPFDAAQQASKSMVEFTLVDAQGMRSEPMRVAIDVAAAPPVVAASVSGSGPATVVAVREIRQAGQTSGGGALLGGAAGAGIGNQFGRGGGRTAMTVLGALAGAAAGHAAESQARGTSTWETTVRFDDGSTRTMTHGRPLGIGQRVTVSRGQVVY